MNLLLTGLNHKTAPVNIREKIAISFEDLPRAFQLFRQVPQIRESLILSTCNRTEVYTVLHAPAESGFISECLGKLRHISPEAFAPHLYTKRDAEAAKHLFCVAGGLDSLVLGEDQILSQVKQYFRLAQEAKSLGTFLHRLFQSAILTGKRIRHETALGENPSSVGEAALELAEQIFGELKGKKLFILGSGEMGRLVAEAFLAKNTEHPMIASRTFENAKALASQMCGTAYAMKEIKLPLEKADIVIAASGGTEPLLTQKMLKPVMSKRRNAPLFVIDIAVPRNVEESAGKLDNLFLYNMDDLHKIVERANEKLEKELGKANQILDEELDKFLAWKESLQVIPTLRALTEKAERIKSKELERILAKLPDLNGKERAAFEHLAHSLVNKILHGPLVELKAYANHPLGLEYLQVVRDLFSLEEER